MWHDCDPPNVMRLSLDTGSYLIYYLSQKFVSEATMIRQSCYSTQRFCLYRCPLPSLGIAAKAHASCAPISVPSTTPAASSPRSWANLTPGDRRQTQQARDPP